MSDKSKHMGLEKLMHNYADYNLWANKTLAGWLLTKPGALIRQDVPSSFPSVLKTLSHLWDTEKFWLAILQGAAQQAWAEFNGDDDEVIPGLLQQSEALASYVSSQGEEA